MRWQQHYTGVYTKRERLLTNVSKYDSNKWCKSLPRQYEAAKVYDCYTILPKAEDVVSSVGCIHSSDEVAVMAMERRDTVIQCKYL